VAQVKERLPSKHKALSSNTSATRRINKYKTILSPIPDLLNRDLHFNKIQGWLVGTLNPGLVGSAHSSSHRGPQSSLVWSQSRLHNY
jgi:hypothetical protein